MMKNNNQSHERHQLTLLEEGVAKEKKEHMEMSNIRVNPFAVREGKELSWRNVNMTTVSILFTIISKTIIIIKE
jgi:hypothetical protein